MWLGDWLLRIMLCVLLGGLTVVIAYSTIWFVLRLRREIANELERWKHR